MGKTVVTNSSTLLVSDNQRRMLCTTVSASSCNEVSKSTLTITKSDPTVVDGFNSFFQLRSNAPVDVKFTPTGNVDEGNLQPEIDPSNFVTGRILSSDPEVGSLLQIAVEDPDQFAKDSLDVTMFNKVTGETEVVTLNKIDTGLFRSSILVRESSVKGEDFDGVMDASVGDTIVLFYVDAWTESDSAQTITLDLTVLENKSKPTLIIREHVKDTGILGFEVRGASIGGVLQIRSSNGALLHSVDITENGSVQGEISVNDLPAEDSYVVTYSYLTPTGEGSVSKVATVTENDFKGVVSALGSVEQGDLITLQLKDFDNYSKETSLIMLPPSGVAGYTEVRIQQVGNTGVYEGSVKLDEDAPVGKYTLRYADVIGDRTELEDFHFNVTDKVVEDPVDEPVEEEPVTPTLFLAATFRVDSLFSIHGSFNGVVLITAVGEDAECEVTIGN